MSYFQRRGRGVEDRPELAPADFDQLLKIKTKITSRYALYSPSWGLLGEYDFLEAVEKALARGPKKPGSDDSIMITASDSKPVSDAVIYEMIMVNGQKYWRKMK
jgi:hypothetical protein